MTSVTITGPARTDYPTPITLQAVVTGRGQFSPLVNWTIYSGGGSLSATTGQSVVFTPPLVSSARPVNIFATSQADPTKFGEIMVTVGPPPPAARFIAGTWMGTETKTEWHSDSTAPNGRRVDRVTTSPRSHTIAATGDYTATLTGFSGAGFTSMTMTFTTDGKLTLAAARVTMGTLPDPVTTYDLISSGGSWSYSPNLSFHFETEMTFCSSFSGCRVEHVDFTFQ